MQRRERIGVWMMVVCAITGIVMLPARNSPTDEAVRVLDLRLPQDDTGWFTFRIMGRPIGIMYRSYALPPENRLDAEHLVLHFQSRLEPLGWKPTVVTKFRNSGFERWTKGSTTVGYSFDPASRNQFFINFERKPSPYESLMTYLNL